MADMEEKARNEAKFPKYGWKVKLDHEFPERRNQNLKPSPRQMIQLAPLGLRYTKWWAEKMKEGKKPVIDQFRPRHSKQMYGAPCGGLGCGSIGRGFRGEFCRFQMVPGIYDYHSVPADQFIVSIHSSTGGECLYMSVLGGRGGREKGAPSSWQWKGRGEDALYCALYPRAWTVYNIPEVGVRIICRQISPFLPGDYTDSSLPVTVFVFFVENNSERDLRVGITFTFKNGTGDKVQDRSGGVWTEPWSEGDCVGVSIHQTLHSTPLEYSVCARSAPGRDVSWCSGWDPRGTGEQVWSTLYGAGLLDSAPTTTQKTRKGEEVAVAVSSRCLVPKGGRTHLEYCLSWNSPKVQFGGGGKEYRRRYTSHWDGTRAGPRMCHHALNTYTDWEDRIELWQSPTLTDPSLPDWFKSAIFNELYFLADGGGVWLEVEEGEGLPQADFRNKYGRWGYLESHEYRMYNTYDVHYYASWALVDLWPGLQLSLQFDILDWTDKEDRENVTELYGGKKGYRKAAGSVPHDLGDPEDEPWVRVNSYNIHDVTHWRDLNLKLVLQVWRDCVWVDPTEGLALVSRALPTLNTVMDTATGWDTDRDGMIENSGRPDQTFDSWVMEGPSAYCGGLWIAALACMQDLCEAVEPGTGSEWGARLQTAKTVYVQKLWNEKYFKFDSSQRGEKVIMADQLAGYWYRSLCGVKGLLEEDKVVSTLHTIYSNNVEGFCSGGMGAVNGWVEGEGVDRSTVQSEEMWTGVCILL